MYPDKDDCQKKDRYTRKNRKKTPQNNTPNPQKKRDEKSKNHPMMQKENTKKRKENDLISSCIECDLNKYQYKLTKMCAPYSGTCTCTSNGSKQVHK